MKYHVAKMLYENAHQIFSASEVLKEVVGEKCGATREKYCHHACRMSKKPRVREAKVCSLMVKARTYSARDAEASRNMRASSAGARRHQIAKSGGVMGII